MTRLQTDKKLQKIEQELHDLKEMVCELSPCKDKSNDERQEK